MFCGTKFFYITDEYMVFAFAGSMSSIRATCPLVLISFFSSIIQKYFIFY